MEIGTLLRWPWTGCQPISVWDGPGGTRLHVVSTGSLSALHMGLVPWNNGYMA